jgi:aqualysin 1
MTAAMLLACGTVWAQGTTTSVTTPAPEQTTTLGGSPAPEQSSPEEGNSERYIVVLEESVANPVGVAQTIDRRQPALQVGFVYTNALEGFSADIPDDSIAEVRANPNVAYVERDTPVTIAAQRLPWGINKIAADSSSTKAGNGRGAVSRVNAYIIDTGIDKTDADLNVVDQVNFAGGSKGDCDGHGTAVAGTVSAMDNAKGVVGAAPGAALTGVKVLGCDGKSSASEVIKGVDWVTVNAKKPAIATLSLSGKSKSRALDHAITKSAASGIFYAVAAGNKGADACHYSPASAGAGTNNGIATVAATKRSNKEPSWSNYGSCVDIWAPGASIPSTRIGGGTTTMSGTSMSAAHVGGGAGLYLSSHRGASPSAVEGALKSAAKKPDTKRKKVRSVLLEKVGRF